MCVVVVFCQDELFSGMYSPTCDSAFGQADESHNQPSAKQKKPRKTR